MNILSDKFETVSNFFSGEFREALASSEAITLVKDSVMFEMLKHLPDTMKFLLRS